MNRSTIARTLISFVAVVGATAGVSANAVSAQAATTTTTVATTATPTLSTDDYEARVLHWINVRRQHHGLRTLRLQSCTDGVAERWASYLASTSEFFHQSMQRVINSCDARYAGETLAKGSVGPKEMVSLWMHSDGHRHILLSKYPHRIGIGAVPDASGAWVVAADFTSF